jgi:hypothetical protein
MARKTILYMLLLLAGASLSWAERRFDHRVHVEEYAAGMDCTTCHLPGATSIVPDKSVCLDCHEQDIPDATRLGATKTHGPVWALNHRSEAKLGAGLDCAACHQQDFCLECHKSGFADEQGFFGNNMINVHTSDFHVSHPIAARTNPQLCSSCHEPSFCSDCHTDFRAGRASGPSHRRTFNLGLNGNFETIHAGMTIDHANSSFCDQCHLQGSVAPSFHDWSQGHAREARKNLVTCQACHPSGDVCLTCHSAASGIGFNPHGKGWSGRAGRLNDASNGRTCRMCH